MSVVRKMIGPMRCFYVRVKVQCALVENGSELKQITHVTEFEYYFICTRKR